MLTISEVNPTGFFSYGLHHTVAIDEQGVVELTGQNHDRITRTANGAGKSSLLNTICHILFGTNPSGATDTTIVNSVWGKGAWGYVKFRSHAGRAYRVVVARKWKGEYPDANFASEPAQILIQNDTYTGTDLYFDEWDGQCWMDRRLTKIPETRKAILDVLGMSYTQFLTTSYLAQQKGIQFVSGKNKDRMQIISELMDLSIWNKGSKIARTKLASINEVALRLRGSVEGKQAALAALPKPMAQDDLDAMEMGILKVEEDRDTAQGSLEMLALQMADIAAEREAVAAQVAALQAQQSAIWQQKALIGDAVLKLQGQHNMAIREVHAAKADDGRIVSECADLHAEIRQLDRAIAESMSGAGTCDRCGSDVSQDQCQSRLEDFESCKLLHQASIQSLMAEAEALRSEQAAANAIKVAELTAAFEADMAAKRAELATLQQQIDQLAAQALSLQSSTELAARGAEVMQEQVRLRGELDMCLRAIDAARLRASMNAQLAANRAHTEKAVQHDTSTLASLEEEMMALNAIIRGMSDKGIKAHKFGSIIDSLNGLVKEYIEILTDNQVQVWFTPWREKATSKTDDDVVAEIQILVKEGPKDEVDLDLYSGAERQQITLAIICAFWRLATQAGGGTNILFLDEIFGMFDAPTAGLVVRLLNKLRETHFGTIVVVTHDTKVSDMIEYDQRWTAIKKDHVSTLHVEGQA